MKHLKTISEFHQFRELPKPKHPLLSVIDIGTVPNHHIDEPLNIVLDFYTIAVKRMGNVKMQYGQQPFDFNEGVMSFMAPGQLFSLAIDNRNEEVKKSGWVIYIHPDFLWNTSLAKTIRQYDFWDYSLNEALFLSEKEEETINNIIRNINQEYNSNIDKFSKQIIITQIEGLLNYADRFYNRQFITRERSNHEILGRLESVVSKFFDDAASAGKGLPTVHDVAEQLHLSPKYLSSLLRSLTGQNTQQYIHEQLIERAKQKLSATTLSVSEIAYELGFEHLQSFSKLFKAKTNISPVKFRQSFN